MFWLCTQAITQIHFQPGAQSESIYGWPDWRIILTIKQGEFSSIIMVCQRVTDLEILASCSRSLKLESSGYIVKDFSQILMQSA